MSEPSQPRIVVLSSLFPHSGQPTAGLFIRERMFRVGRHLPLVVVVPVPWFPFQGLLRRWRRGFRPPAPWREEQQGITVHFPRFFCVPGLFKSLDGWFMAQGVSRTLRALAKQFQFNVLDAHFAFPEGYAASLLGKQFGVPVTITLRGTEVPLARSPGRRKRIVAAIARARRVFAVSESLKGHVIALGARADHIQVVGNGVDLERFHPIDREAARRELGLPPSTRVLISVGGLVERKGFHRVIDCLPELRTRFPDLTYLVVGGPGPEGDWSERLRSQVRDLGLESVVRFLGPIPPERLRVPLSAAEAFVLATGNEGWANVFLEAMACGLPVVTTDVGGNREVVCRPDLGRIVPFGDRAALAQALADALETPWDRPKIMAYAAANSWDRRTEILVREFRTLVRG